MIGARLKVADRCASCANHASEEFVTMWDGRVYCRRCVDTLSPALYAFAFSGAALEDTVNHDDVRTRYFLTYVGNWYQTL